MTTMTMRESATRHMAAGVDNLDELARLVEADTGRASNRKVLSSYRSYFRRHGPGWVEVSRAETCEASKRWHKSNREQSLQKNRQWKAENPARTLLGNCRASAKQRGHECTLTVEMVEEMIATMVCSVTGLPLTWEHDGSSRSNPWAPSVDRIDCSHGYVPGNVRVVCVLYNLARNSFPDEAVVTMAKALAARAP